MPKTDVSISFSRLIEALSADAESAAKAYVELQGSLARYFKLRGHSDPERLGDETLDRVQAKLDQGTQIQNIIKYCFGVARLISLEQIRREQRDRTAHFEYYSARERETHDEMSDRDIALKACFDRLTLDDRSLLADYFADMKFSERKEHRESLAVKYGISLNNLRLKVFRLRQQLDECVRRRP